MTPERIRGLLEYAPHLPSGLVWNVGKRKGRMAGSRDVVARRFILTIDGASITTRHAVWMWLYGEVPAGKTVANIDREFWEDNQSSNLWLVRGKPPRRAMSAKRGMVKSILDLM